jgi:hypothetical protein
MTYTELVAAIQSYTENTFSTTEVNTFITQAETRIFNAAKLPSLRKLGTLTPTNGVQYLDAPTDMLAPDYLAVIDGTGTYTFLLPKDPSFIREAYPTVAATGTPKYYALFGPALTGGTPNTHLRFILGPTPTAGLTIETQYFYYPESITTIAGGQTWLGDSFSPVLLYGSLVEAYTFMKGDTDLMTKYDQMFKDALTEVIALANRQRQDEYRVGTK